MKSERSLRETLRELEGIGQLVDKNDRDLEEMQDEAYRLTDDLIDKYYDLKENQNEEIDGIIEKYLLKYDQSGGLIKKIDSIEGLWRASVKRHNELEMRELQLKNQVMEREVAGLQDDLRREEALMEQVHRKLAKCLGVKKKLRDDRAHSPRVNGARAEAEAPLVYMKEKYSAYLFGYLKDVSEKTVPYMQNQNGSAALEKSLYRSNVNLKESRVSSIRSQIVGDAKSSKLKEFEEYISMKQEQIRALSCNLEKIAIEESSLRGQKTAAEKNLQEIGKRNSELVEHNQALSRQVKSVRAQLLGMLQDPGLSVADVVSRLRLKLANKSD